MVVVGDRTVVATQGRLMPVFCRGKPAPACDPPRHGQAAAFLHDLQHHGSSSAEPGSTAAAHPDREWPDPGHQAPRPDPVSLCWRDLPCGPSGHHCVDKVKLPLPPAVVSGVWFPPGCHEFSWKTVSERAFEGNPNSRVSRPDKLLAELRTTPNFDSAPSRDR